MAEARRPWEAGTTRVQALTPCTTGRACHKEGEQGAPVSWLHFKLQRWIPV